MGPFSLDDPKDYSVDVRISDGGRPIQASVTKLAIKVGSAAAWSKKKHENSGRRAQRLRPRTHHTLLKVQTRNEEFIISPPSHVGAMPGGFPRSAEPELGGWE